MSTCCPTNVPPVPPESCDFRASGCAVYIAGSRRQHKRGVLFVPDIFGPHPMAYHTCDWLAAQGFVVVMPDFFQGRQWKLADYPPTDQATFQAFLSELTYDKLKDKVVEGVNILKSLGAHSDCIGALGMCWGAKIALRANCDGLVCCSAGAHPSFVNATDVTEAKGPVCLLPSKDEGEMTEVREAVEHHATFAKSNVFRRFDDMHHGWAAARGDLSNALNKQRYEEAMTAVTTFFNTCRCADAKC